MSNIDMTKFSDRATALAKKVSDSIKAIPDSDIEDVYTFDTCKNTDDSLRNSLNKDFFEFLKSKGDIHTSVYKFK